MVHERDGRGNIAGGGRIFSPIIVGWIDTEAAVSSVVAVAEEFAKGTLCGVGFDDDYVGASLGFFVAGLWVEGQATCFQARSDDDYGAFALGVLQVSDELADL